MSLNFKYIPLTFLKDLTQIKEQVKNTIILSHFFDKNKSEIKLEELIEGTQYGYNASALQAGKNKFLRISDITDGIVNWKSVPFCDCTDEKTYLLKKDDLLVARTGGTTGKSFIIENPPSKAIYAGYLIRIRANENSIPQYLNLFLNSYAYWSQVLSLNKGEFRPSVNATKLKQLILPKCSIQEQKDAINISKGKIVKGYEKLNKRIEKTLLEFDNCQSVLNEYNTQKLLLTQLKQAILQEAIQGKLTADWRKQSRKLSGPNTEPASKLLKRIKAEKAQLIADKKIKKEKPLPPITKEEIPFDLPDGWVWTKLDEIVLFKNGKAHEQFVDKNGKYILINSRFVSTNGNTKKYTGEQMMPMFKNEIAIVMSDVPNGRALSRCYLINENEKYSLNQRIGGLIPLKDVFHHYLMIVLDRNKHYLAFNDGKKQTNLKKVQVMSCPVPLPPFSEQKEIVKKVEALMQHCQALEQEIKTSEANAQMLMQAVLKEAFEGETKKEMV